MRIWSEARKTFFGAVIAMLCTACGPATDDGESEWVEPPEVVGEISYALVAPGDGEANDALLDPLVPGQMLIAGGQTEIYRAVGGPATSDGIDFVEVWYGSGRATFEANTDAGLVRFGSDETGLTGQATVLVPPTVKVGMKWLSKERHFKVTGRILAPTQWGERVVWTITEAASDEGQASCTRQYVEGHGLRYDSCLGLTDLDTALEPLDWTAAPVPADTAPIEPLKVAGIQWGMSLGAEHLWSVDLKPGLEPMVVTVRGKRLEKLLWGGSPEEDYTCLTVTAEDEVFERSPSPVAENLFTDDLQVLHGPPTCPWGIGKDDIWGWTGGRHALQTWLRSDATGGAWYGWTGKDGRVRTKSQDLFTLLGRSDEPEPVVVTWQFLDTTEYDGLAALLGRFTNAGLRLVLAPLQETEGIATLGMVDGGGLLSSIDLVDTSSLKDVRFGPYVGNYYSVRVTAQERDILLVSPAGAIDRLALADDRWVRTSVADVALPPGHAAYAGAFALANPDGQEQLLLFARALVPWSFSFADGDVEESQQPVTTAWLLDLPEEPPERPWIAALSVTAEKIGADARVCWPAAGNVELEGWTIGGAPARGVYPHFDGDQCVAVIRDTAAALSPDAPGGMVVEGPVPGVGSMRIAMSPGTGETVEANQFTGGAALTGGGFAAPNGVFDKGAFLVKRMLLDAPYSEFFRDRGGHGLWYWVPGKTEQTGLHLISRAGDDNLFGPVGGDLVALPYGGGIVIWNQQDGNRKFSPDGQVTELPDAYKLLYNVGFLSHGSACGNGYNGAAEHQESIYCYTADGDETLVSDHPDHGFGTGENHPWYPVADRYFVNVNWLGTWIVDSEVGSIAEYDDATSLDQVVYAADGECFGLLGERWVKLAPDGPEELDFGPYQNRVTGLYADEGLFILLLDDGTSARLPRP